MCFWCYILSEYPKEFNGMEWDFTVLSSNESVCFDCVKNNIDNKWDFNLLGKHLDLLWDSMTHYFGGNFHFEIDGFKFSIGYASLLANRKTPLHIITAYSSVFSIRPYSSFHVSQNKNLTWDFIEKHPDGIGEIPWYVSALSEQSFLPLNFVTEHPEGILDQRWDMERLCRNKALNWDFFQKCYVGTKDTRNLSANKHFVKSFYENDPEGFCKQYWDVSILSGNPSLPWDLVGAHPEGLNRSMWNMERLSSNKSLPWSFVEKHPKGLNGIPWCVRFLSENPNLDWSFVEKHPEGFNSQPWDMKYLTKNPELPLNFVKNHPEGWNLMELSSKRGLTWNFLEEYPNGLCGKSWAIGYLCRQKWKKDTDRIRFRKVKAIAQ